MNKNTENLFQLIKENPDLPVVPMVDYEVCTDDDCCCRWMGSWGAARIDEYLFAGERIYFKDEDDADDVLEHFMDYDDLVSLTDEQATETYNALPWVRCIVVDINLPD